MSQIQSRHEISHVSAIEMMEKSLVHEAEGNYFCMSTCHGCQTLGNELIHDLLTNEKVWHVRVEEETLEAGCSGQLCSRRPFVCVMTLARRL